MTGTLAPVTDAKAPRSPRLLLRHPSAVLLAAQLIGVLLYPFVPASGEGRVLLEVFGALVLALAIWSVRHTAGRGQVLVSIALGIAASGLSVADAIEGSWGLALPSALLHALFYFWAAGNLMVYMLADHDVTVDELFAVGATFTLVAWAFAYVFAALQLVQPGCFTAAVDPLAQRTWVELLFLSFTNLTSTGLSDILPVTAHARSVVMIEHLAGVGYVALFVSRLVGLTVSRNIRGSGQSQAELSPAADSAGTSRQSPVDLLEAPQPGQLQRAAVEAAQPQVGDRADDHHHDQVERDGARDPGLG
jgi:hypothetical protein